MYVRGWSYEAIGAELGISAATSSMNMHFLFQKLQVKSRAFVWFVLTYYVPRGTQLVRKPTTPTAFADLTSKEPKAWRKWKR